MNRFPTVRVARAEEIDEQFPQVPKPEAPPPAKGKVKPSSLVRDAQQVEQSQKAEKSKSMPRTTAPNVEEEEDQEKPKKRRFKGRKKGTNSSSEESSDDKAKANTNIYKIPIARSRDVTPGPAARQPKEEEVSLDDDEIPQTNGGPN